MSPLLTVLSVLLVPMGLLPVLAAVVLWRHRRSESLTLRERAQVQLVLAAVAVSVAFLALNRVVPLNIPQEWVSVPFVGALLLMDIQSGRWLWQYWFGRFSERTGGGPETATERQDREVGDERRSRQEADSIDAGDYR